MWRSKKDQDVKLVSKVMRIWVFLCPKSAKNLKKNLRLVFWKGMGFVFFSLQMFYFEIYFFQAISWYLIEKFSSKKSEIC